MKKITTKITDANEGMHDPRAYKGAKEMLENHDYEQARLYHLRLTDSNQVEPYLAAIKALVAHLRKNNIRCQYKAAVEEDDGQGIHMHVFLLVEAKLNNPCHIINRKADGWLAIMLLKRGLDFSLNSPRSAMHYGKDQAQKNYASVPKTKGAKIADCVLWISYLYKNRSKPDLEQIYYSSRPTRERLENRRGE